MQKRTKHHRKCRSNGGDSQPSNIVYVPKRHHEAWHRLFQNLEAHAIAELINELWLDPSWELVARRRT